MKKIFGLWGATNRGKTTTLNLLIDLLSKDSETYDNHKTYDSKAWFVINEIKIGELYET